MRDDLAELRRRVARLEASVRMRDRRRVEPLLIGGGAELERARKVAGWSAVALAAAISCRKQSMRQWELNDVPLPRSRAQQILTVFARSDVSPPNWGIDSWDDDDDRVVGELP